MNETDKTNGAVNILDSSHGLILTNVLKEV